MHAACQDPGTVVRLLKQSYNFYGFQYIRNIYPEVPVISSRPDIVHFEFGSTAVGRLRHARALGWRTVVSFRGYDLNYVGLENPGFYQEVWEYADAIHCLGSDLWARAQRRGCPPSKPHALIPPAIDTDFFHPVSSDRVEAGSLGTPDRPIHLLSVGRLEWKKGYEYALAAVRLLMDRGLSVEYRIVGDGAYLEAVAFCIRQLGLANVVQLAGPASQSAVRDHMAWADLFLHAAVSEGFCNAVLEAQAMELPVVTSDADGLGENVVHGETGFVVARRDPEALAVRMEQLAADSRLRRRMGIAGRSRVTAQFRLPDQIEAFHQLYSRVL
jgi:colanic acid/amylovoran biosynthesis glycosyltransferase